MKNYIIKNSEPLLIGFLVALLAIYLFDSISDIILKIALIQNEK